MHIIVKHLNTGITVDDLHDFVSPTLKGGWFYKTADLKAIKVVGIVDKQGMIVERHGLIRITPESEKARVVKALNSSRKFLEKFAVAEYVIRHWSNDRRAANPTPDYHPNNRRANDRRRLGLRMITVCDLLTTSIRAD